MGKTAFTLALARNAAIDHDKPVAFFSLEMSSGQLVQRLISMETEIEAKKLRDGNLQDHEWAQLITKVDKLEKAKLFMDDTPSLSIFELRAKARKLKKTNDIQMIIIDYLQLMTGTTPDGKTNGNREQEISGISRSLKGLAKELNIPIIALSQLSRSNESRQSKKPQLSDLRDSGAIEQDADMVMFLYRPEYYKITEDEDGNSTEGIAEVLIEKHRNGDTGVVKTRFNKGLAKFEDLSSQKFAFNSGLAQSDPFDSDAPKFVTHTSKISNDNVEKIDDSDFDMF
jgi:replicative DNA helicase